MWGSLWEISGRSSKGKLLPTGVLSSDIITVKLISIVLILRSLITAWDIKIGSLAASGSFYFLVDSRHISIGN